MRKLKTRRNLQQTVLNWNYQITVLYISWEVRYESEKQYYSKRFTVFLVVSYQKSCVVLLHIFMSSSVSSCISGQVGLPPTICWTGGWRLLWQVWWILKIFLLIQEIKHDIWCHRSIYTCFCLIKETSAGFSENLLLNVSVVSWFGLVYFYFGFLQFEFFEHCGWFFFLSLNKKVIKDLLDRVLLKLKHTRLIGGCQLSVLQNCT